MKKLIFIIILILITGCSLSSTNLYGKWKTSNNNLLYLKEDNSFYFYYNYENLDTDYYSGFFELKNKKKALEELNISKDDLKNNNWKISNLYYLKLNIEQYNINNEIVNFEDNRFIQMLIYYDKKTKEYSYYDLTNGYSGTLIKN